MCPTRALQCIKQMLTAIKGRISNNTTIVGYSNTTFVPIDRLSRQKSDKETALKWHIKLERLNIYRSFHPRKAKYTFSSVHRTFSMIDHVLGHKASHGKFMKIEILSSIFCNHNAMRLEINYRKKKTVKNTNMKAKKCVAT